MSKNKITIFVGDTSDNLISVTRSHDADCKKISSHNAKNLQPGTYYTSLGYLDSLFQFGTVLAQADIAIYVPPKVWSDATGSMKSWTEDYLQVLSCDNSKQVIGLPWHDAFDSENFTDLADHRYCETPQIWIAGCSISHGVGVTAQQKYGNLISKKIDLPVSYLTRSGASISWAGDQILRSDVRSKDIIFWGITDPYRMTYLNSDTGAIGHCNLNTFKKNHSVLRRWITEEFLMSDNMIYQSLLSVHQVANFCRKVGAQLIMATLMRGLEPKLRNFYNFLPLAGLYGRDSNNLYADLGTDGVHPGPRSHEIYAERMLDMFRSVYEESQTS